MKIDLEFALFYWEITAFEDLDRIWEMPFEDLECFQFEKGSVELDAKRCEMYAEAADGFRKNCPVSREEGGLERIDKAIGKVSAFIARSCDLVFDKRGSFKGLFKNIKEIRKAFDEYLGANSLAEIEKATAEAIVSNPYSGEWLRQIYTVLASCGFSEYRGRMLRQIPAIPPRADVEKYIIYRMAFMRAVFASNNIMGITAYRGMSSPTGWSLFSKSLSAWACEYLVARDLAGISAPNGAEMPISSSERQGRTKYS